MDQNSHSVLKSLPPHLLPYIEDLIARGGPEPEEYDTLNSWIQSVDREVNAGNISTESVRDYWRHISETFLGGTLQSHVVKCPRGYHGDFEIIDHTYQQRVHDHPALARWDRFLHAQDAPVALRNRKTYFLSLLAEHETRMKGTRLEVLNIGSGPGRDILEWFEKHGRTSVHFDCVDIDPEAITHAKALLTRFFDTVSFHQLNALRFSTQRKYQLVWSGGLFDYLPDGLFVRLLKRLLRFTAPGGEVVIGNFSRACTEL